MADQKKSRKPLTEMAKNGSNNPLAKKVRDNDTDDKKLTVSGFNSSI